MHYIKHTEVSGSRSRRILSQVSYKQRVLLYLYLPIVVCSAFMRKTTTVFISYQDSIYGRHQSKSLQMDLYKAVNDRPDETLVTSFLKLCHNIVAEAEKTSTGPTHSNIKIDETLLLAN